ncbi:sodium-extruding oxaloacetate decarboxylase subunit alpha [Pseudoalteromonas sp. McH1-7]|uniref:Oxaloacetate decarboxylase, alpha subunit n=1 Tax=Pseudoalteromonas peptidolytica F12-50-A1 TaxID=1315280 RepID=A0A8I0MTS6_9GAMM|nr:MULTISPECIES: sodium-extruding oxaloacetate decarboxylase subunit alpha [Pseudoalteromonas]MBE0345591.1 oxaloacetate decarboxylase, alpha subunit [Pseudoalteromonas peptidolytica F12-50-A1]NLR13527.1 oxaloacetate decarboxylase subunit alpha [Pseudoalteromonas peptidolytica]NUZ11257.1 sodium-extruding oxaloacetate decarboxylase subunit alpha [Pseudoalteromonas sp. McH1-7]USD27695.1 sodium-extruding oxaloacetate decarboxylase subunit alpha [Pseudoalteromonas sp. SCSIO 43201]GEK09337.1 oxaloac
MSQLKLTELVLRDAHQSLLATRMRLEDMLPIAEQLDNMGYWSVESWGGATFDSCIRYLGEDPWERIRALKAAMPKTKQQMLLRGQNLLGYRHYADDVVEKFVERAHHNGVDVFRIFDAMNDVRNLETAIKAAIKVGAHAQGTISYTVSPVHTLEMWLTQAKQLEDLGCHSICIKDMAGLLKPYDAEKLISGLKQTVSIPIAMQCHATTGLSTATYQKAIDAGIDMLDTAISSMSMTYGHSATETIAAIVEGTERDTGLDLLALEEIAAYFREVRKKYAAFEGSLKGVDGRILSAQVPGGMLTNMENQLREQGAGDKLDAVLKEIPSVRKELGYLPLVTPTSQIVGTQAVLNVLTGERYKSITKETAGVLKGEYGATPADVDHALQQRVLEGKEPITCRPADLIEPELDSLQSELIATAKSEQVTLAEDVIDDVLTYALFPQIGLKFLKNRNNPDAFEPKPTQLESKEQKTTATPATGKASTPERYSVKVDGKVYDVVVAPGGELQEVQVKDSELIPQSTSVSSSETLNAPLAGNIFKLMVRAGDEVQEGDVVLVMEAMKMETEVRATHSGRVAELLVSEGDSVSAGDAMMSLA